jgi:hypothetical protein
VLNEAKLLIERVIRKRTGIKKIAFRKVDEDTFATTKTLPYAAIYSADGSFDERTARIIKIRTPTGGLNSVQVRGTRKVPFEIRVAARTEDESDRALGDILRYLPLKWNLGDYGGTLNILTEHHDDYSSHAKEQSTASAFVMITMEIGTDPEAVPQIGGAVVEPAS